MFLVVYYWSVIVCGYFLHSLAVTLISPYFCYLLLFSLCLKECVCIGFKSLLFNSIRKSFVPFDSFSLFSLLLLYCIFTNEQLCTLCCFIFILFLCFFYCYPFFLFPVTVISYFLLISCDLTIIACSFSFLSLQVLHVHSLLLFHFWIYSSLLFSLSFR